MVFFLSSRPTAGTSLRRLKVPVHIHEAWVKGGTERARLGDMLREAGFQKDWRGLEVSNRAYYNTHSYPRILETLLKRSFTQSRMDCC